ncbi:MAG TPA: hypothetical protein VK034_01605 [Enhygromyxa sp.]|nr:hypothetical protein [Enhygromyxa sp.]
MSRAAPKGRRPGAGSRDLFEHFGVGTGHEPRLPAAIVAAAPCSSCGWLRRADDNEGGCPLCAAPPGKPELEV